MKQSCEIIRDLLPLYLDDVCSGDSRELVETHLTGCGTCAALLQRLKSNTVEENLREEKNGILKRHARRLRKRSMFAGSVMAVILLVPILICLIVNLASGHTLNWFFPVLTAILLVASATLVPLLVPNNRFFWTCTGLTGSLLLLLGTCCLYTRGSWFLTAAAGCLLGISVFLLPFAAQREPLRKALGRGRPLFLAGMDTVFLALLLLVIGLHTTVPHYGLLAFGITVPLAAFGWILFLMFRFLPSCRLTKAGLCVLLCGVFAYFSGPLIGTLIHLHMPLPKIAPLCWNSIDLTGNACLITMAVGLILTILGLLRQFMLNMLKGRKENEL